MKLRILSIVALFSFIFAGDLFAQMENPLEMVQEKEPILIGPVFGYNRSMHTADIPSFAGDALCPTFSDGSNNGFYGGLSIEYLFGKQGASTQSLIFRGTYSTLPAYFEEGGDTYPSEVIERDPVTNEIVNRYLIESSTLHSNEITYDLFEVDVLYKLNFIGNKQPLGLLVGPTFGFGLTKNWNQQYKLIEPLNVQFEEEFIDNNGDGVNDISYSADRRTIYLEDGEIENSSSFRFGLKVGLQYEIQIGNGWMLVPVVMYNLGVTNLSTDLDWRVNALQMGIDLRYAWKILG
jgi:hypothetical protein